MKWYRGIFGINYIEEITLDGEVLSTYTNNNTQGIILACIASGIFFLAGLGCVFLYHERVRDDMKHLQKKYRNM